MTTFQRALLLRFAVCLLIAFVLALGISEGAFWLQRDQNEHAAQDFVLRIPAGTSGRVANGINPVTIPPDAVFFEGDAIIVENEDDVPHQLGPVWAPAHGRGVLRLEKARQYSFACSFTATRFLGLEVRPRVDTATRIQAVLAIGLPTGLMLGLYSLVLYPVHPGGDPTIKG